MNVELLSVTRKNGTSSITFLLSNKLISSSLTPSMALMAARLGWKKTSQHWAALDVRHKRASVTTGDQSNWHRHYLTRFIKSVTFPIPHDGPNHHPNPIPPDPSPSLSPCPGVFVLYALSLNAGVTSSPFVHGVYVSQPLVPCSDSGLVSMSLTSPTSNSIYYSGFTIP